MPIIKAPVFKLSRAYSFPGIRAGFLDWKRAQPGEAGGGGLYEKIMPRRVTSETAHAKKKPPAEEGMERTVTGKHIKVMFDEDTKRWLFKESDRRGISVSQIIRDAVKRERVYTESKKTAYK